MKITTCTCTSVALLLLTPFVRGQAAAGGGVVVVTTPPPATMVWITTTNAAGQPITEQIAYTQTFSTFNGVIQSPKSGSIGLGSTITGQVGVTKTVAPQKRDAMYTQAPIVQDSPVQKEKSNDAGGMSGKDKLWMTLATAGVVGVLGGTGAL